METAVETCKRLRIRVGTVLKSRHFSCPMKVTGIIHESILVTPMLSEVAERRLPMLPLDVRKVL